MKKFKQWLIKVRKYAAKGAIWICGVALIYLAYCATLLGNWARDGFFTDAVIYWLDYPPPNIRKLVMYSVPVLVQIPVVALFCGLFTSVPVIYRHIKDLFTTQEHGFVRKLFMAAWDGVRMLISISIIDAISYLKKLLIFALLFTAIGMTVFRFGDDSQRLCELFDNHSETFDTNIFESLFAYICTLLIWASSYYFIYLIISLFNFGFNKIKSEGCAITIYNKWINRIIATASFFLLIFCVFPRHEHNTNPANDDNPNGIRYFLLHCPAGTNNHDPKAQDAFYFDNLPLTGSDDYYLQQPFCKCDSDNIIKCIEDIYLKMIVKYCMTHIPDCKIVSAKEDKSDDCYNILLYNRYSSHSYDYTLIVVPYTGFNNFDGVLIFLFIKEKLINVSNVYYFMNKFAIASAILQYDSLDGFYGYLDFYDILSHVYYTIDICYDDYKNFYIEDVMTYVDDGWFYERYEFDIDREQFVYKKQSLNYKSASDSVASPPKGETDNNSK
jgi:hypothetical protein